MAKLSLLLAVLVFFEAKAQNEKYELKLIQGIWANNMNGVSGEYLFKILHGTNSLAISYHDSSRVQDFYLNECLEGFQNATESADSIHVDSLRRSGKFFTTILDKDRVSKRGWIKTAFCIIPNYFECNGENMSINGGKLMEYHKIDRLPVRALKLIVKRGRHDKRNYTKDYLDVDVSEIKSDSPISAEFGGVAKLILPKGELVYLKEIIGDWQKIEYEKNEDVQQGWVERKYLK